MNWSNKTVLVTGGAGFIGKKIASKLLNKNARVYIMDDFSYSSPSEVIDCIELLTADVSNTSMLNSTLANVDVDYIFHFAAPSSIVLFNHEPIKCFKTTTLGVMNIFYYALENNVRKIVFPSSGSVYGKVSPPQSELHVPEPVNLYAVAKYSTECIARLFADRVKYTSLRIFAGYGPGELHKKDYASPVTIFLESIMNNKKPIIFGDGSQSRDFVYITDVVEAAIKSVESPFSGGVINVGSGSSYTFNQVVDLINDLLGKRLVPEYVKKPTSYLERTCADIKRMKDVLGITPMSLSDGLNAYLETLHNTCVNY